MGDRYLLILTPPDILEDPAIVVHDIFEPSRRWMFQLPPLVQGMVGGGPPGEGGEGISIRRMQFISEPGATWRPSTMLPPFYVARRERLIVFVMNVIFDHRQPMVSLTVSTLSSRLLACIEAVEPPIEGVDRRVMWQDWGDKNCRMGYWPSRWDGGWPCVTYGTKYACLEENRVTIYDFNQPAVRHGASRNGDHEGSSSTEYVMHSTDLETGFFDKPVVTSLPYRKMVTCIGTDEADYVMISEDSFVIVQASPWISDVSAPRSELEDLAFSQAVHKDGDDQTLVINAIQNARKRYIQPLQVSTE
ncbi:hypothetical protein PHLCEN_2v6206 [Hermanssonia centrifuga]|uniref:Uncharacterized protein n=1 Tax=Hermanssonia centrifuga TaxID=98765 RepID=A0A2R6P030_9APHY|nr:hypothetical protein PHLCEN_2v6206 [Hermanssonia centrifuga]